METVKDIIQVFGYDDVESLPINELLEVENEPFMKLGIEIYLPKKLIVGHYYTQNGDLMSDPEIVFDISNGSWTPIRHTQHGVPEVHESDPEGLGRDVVEFAKDWDDRLRNQGFVDAAKEENQNE